MQSRPHWPGEGLQGAPRHSQDVHSDMLFVCVHGYIPQQHHASREEQEGVHDDLRCQRARETQGAVLKGLSASGPFEPLLERHFLGPTQTCLGASRAVLVLYQAPTDVLMYDKGSLLMDVK